MHLNRAMTNLNSKAKTHKLFPETCKAIRLISLISGLILMYIAYTTLHNLNGKALKQPDFGKEYFQIIYYAASREV